MSKKSSKNPAPLPGQKSMLSFFGAAKKPDAPKKPSDVDISKEEATANKEEAQSSSNATLPPPPKHHAASDESKEGIESNSKRTSSLPDSPSKRPRTHDSDLETLRRAETTDISDSPTELDRVETTDISETDSKIAEAEPAPLLRVTIGHLEVTICEGNIIEISTDAVLNPTNSQMQHVSGVGKALVRAEGTQAIIVASDEYKRQHGKLQPGCVAATTAGKLKFKKIIHAVTPRYEQRKGDEEELGKMVSRAFRLAESEALSSITIPAVGAGHAGFPAKKSAQCILSACKMFRPHGPTSKFSQVTIVLDNLLSPIFLPIFSGGDSSASDTDPPPKSINSALISKGETQSVKKKDHAGTSASSTSSSKFFGGGGGGGGRKSEEIASHLTIGSHQLIVVRGDITKEKVDCIVNAANSRLQHAGGIAAAIVRAGGDVIQSESDAIISKRGKIANGEVVKTSAGSLAAQFVFHTVGPVWDQHSPAENDSLLRKCVVSCLELAHRENMHDISIPAISSGIYGFPKDRCAEVMVSEVCKWSADRMDSSLRIIRFTNIDEATATSFKAQFIKKFGTSFS